MFYFTYCLHNSCRLLQRNHNSKKTQKSQQQQKEKKTGSRENKVTKSRRAKKPDWKTTQKNKNRTNCQPIPFV